MQMDGAEQRIRIGDFDVTAISDGFLTRPQTVMIGAAPQDIADLAGKALSESLIISVNAYLIEGRGIRALVDAGSGTSMGPDLGLLPQNLIDSGRALDSITHVLLTHIHPDHTNGLIDAAGTALFPKAEVIVHEDEIAYWVDRELSQARDEGQLRNMANARKAFAPYGAQTTRTVDRECLPGIRVAKSPGHTPGHSCWTIESDGDSLVIWGDTLHLPIAQLANPDIGWSRDIDAAMAITSRKRLLDQLSVERSRVAGMHHDFPGFARLRREQGRYYFDPG
jgi:glyoxylase-like metal-dependent hydrolase (beta-lactamase superfamily II)